jgi:TorA maturation chaperone TorD
MTFNINSMNTTDELLQAYTSLLLFLGGAVSMAPEKIGLPQLCDSGMLRNLPVESRNREFEQAARLLRSPCPFKQHCHVTVGSNYDKLLSDRSSSQAYPSASHWTTRGKPAEEHRRSLAGIYSRYGYSRDTECHLEDDHLGIELLFVNILIEKYLTEEDDEIREMIRKELVTFITDEMLLWLPRWAEKVSEKSVTKCYTGISGLIIGSLEDVKDILYGQKFGL